MGKGAPTGQVVQDAVQAVDRHVRQAEAVAAHGVRRRPALLRDRLVSSARRDHRHRACAVACACACSGCSAAGTLFTHVLVPHGTTATVPVHMHAHVPV